MEKTMPEINKKAIDKVIKDILILRKDLQLIGHRVTPDIAGFYGELLAWKRLRKAFGTKDYAIKFGSGQSKADIMLWKKNRKINIEVKTSRLKEEWFGVGYGFAINIKKCRLHPSRNFQHPKRGRVVGDFCYFDYLLAVLLSEDLRKARFYIFPRQFLEKNEHHLRNRNKRFSSATHRIVFIEKAKKTDEVTKFDKSLAKNKRQFENAWHLIK
ncbi:MAG TPA: hypothetical protein ACFYEK_12830 [Candidatus Wunengus sp. YC60]|uniref:hypothetical protein n=1 Tax=Candidatus Wunengus sp. YC60 TaxID=3367697 RepID=UPI004029B247